jgi:hypothetical protein
MLTDIKDKSDQGKFTVRRFAIMLRSKGSSTIRWQREKQKFDFVKPHKKSPYDWPELKTAIGKLDLVTNLKRDKNPLLGSSSNSRNTPIVKTIVICNDTKLSPSATPDLWEQVGPIQALRIATGEKLVDGHIQRIGKGSLTYVIHKDDLVDFLTYKGKV